MRLRLLTWNLKGSLGVDVARVADHIRSAGADVVALQEVQRRQAGGIARALGARSHRWAFKHQPAGTRAEGMTLVGVTRVVSSVHARALAHRWRPWSWRRRIVQVGMVDGGATVLNVHLTPHEAASQRAAEVTTVVEMVAAATGPVIVAGDLNERPDAPLHERLARAGLRDAWPSGATHAGLTNWRDWRPGTTALPTQRIDYVYVSAGVEVVSADVPGPGAAELAPFASLSDHLPVTAELAWGASRSQG